MPKGVGDGMLGIVDGGMLVGPRSSWDPEEQAQRLKAREKLWAGAAFAEEYRWCLGTDFNVEYAFCLSSYLQKDFLSETKKYTFLRHYLAKEGVPVLFGEAPDYYATLDAWLGL